SPLALHDALPICGRRSSRCRALCPWEAGIGDWDWGLAEAGWRDPRRWPEELRSCESPITNHESRPYRMLMTVWVAWSWVEIICALAWKLRCAVIMLTNCSVRSTVEASRAPDLMRPKSEESGAPLRGLPEA